MKMRSQSDTSSVDGFGRTFQYDAMSKSAGGKLIRGFQRLWKGPAGQTTSQMSSSAPSNIDGARAAIQEEPQINTPLIVVPTVEQCLEDQRFCEASRLLIERENRLFGDIMGQEKVGSPEEEVAKLSAERAHLEELVLRTVEQSLSLKRDPGWPQLPALSAAVQAIQQEEHQDQLWRRKGWTPPDWRPCSWKRLHDAKVRELVEERMENHLTLPSDPLANQSSIKANIHSMGLQMKEDLLLVVEVVKSCYPPEMDICNFYAAQYHQTFSTKLSSLAQFGLDDSDCSFLLRWVNEHYPRILQKPELSAEFDTSGLGKLLPEDLLQPLERQYLSKQQTELTTFMDRVLEEAIDGFNNGAEPAKEDGCYVSTVAFDIIQLINGMVNSAEVIVGDLAKAQSITCELEGLMLRFQSFQAAVIKQNKASSRAQVKANLSCIAQFSDVLVRKKRLLPTRLQENCLSTLNGMKQSAHAYLLTPVHKVLKPHYQKLGTNDWLQNGHFQKLLAAIEKELQELQGSIPSCNQELMGRLHQEVTEEYVKRLLRGDVKLKDKEKQHQACTTVKDDAESLHKLFSGMGSQEEWLKEILHKIAEVLRLQDVPALQMQVASLGSDYPDISEKHVSALIKLKTNISKVDRRTIKATLVETLDSCRTNDAHTRTFFSRVDVR